MNLNQKGWGYTTMAILLTVLFIFFIVAIIYINRFYDRVDNTTPNSSYVNNR